MKKASWQGTIYLKIIPSRTDRKGNALWAEPSNQQRLIALWQEIARRYKDDPIVAGYDILNEYGNLDRGRDVGIRQDMIDLLRKYLSQ